MPVVDGFLVRPVMTAVTGLPQDEVVNDWVFRWTGAGVPSSLDFDNLCQAVGDFYDLGAAAANKVGNYMSSWIDRGATHRIDVYSIDVLPMGPPVHSIAWLGPATNAAVQNVPNEVAGVLSFHGDLTGIHEEAGATRPRARRRGRIYVGPLNLAAIATGDNPLLTDAFNLAMRANANVMAAAAAADDWEWSVWSRVASTLHPVVAGWTDNAPDTQRRRGEEASARVVFTV